MTNLNIVELLSILLEDWGYSIILILMVLENTLFLGVLVPGVVVLIVAGYYAATGLFSLKIVLCMAIIGTLLGDNASYLLGRYFGARVVTIPESIKEIVAKRPWVIFVFHHTPLTRMFIPAFFGMNRKLSFTKWITLNVISTVLFVVPYIYLGYYGALVYNNQLVTYDTVQSYIIIGALAIISIWIIMIRNAYRSNKRVGAC